MKIQIKNIEGFIYCHIFFKGIKGSYIFFIPDYREICKVT